MTGKSENLPLVFDKLQGQLGVLQIGGTQADAIGVKTVPKGSFADIVNGNQREIQALCPEPNRAVAKSIVKLAVLGGGSGKDAPKSPLLIARSHGYSLKIDIRVVVYPDENAVWPAVLNTAGTENKKKQPKNPTDFHVRR